MNQEVNALFERHLVLTEHAVSDQSKCIPIKNAYADVIKPSYEIEDGYESSIGNEEEGDVKNLDLDTHFDEMFEGIDNPTYAPAQTNLNDKYISLSKELINAIVKQMEYYFSDENLINDNYLMKQINPNKQNYISLKQFLSFRRMKKLTTDYGVLDYSIRTASKKLQINKDRVRRIEDISEHIRNKLSQLERSVITNTLPANFITAPDALKNHFLKCGNVLEAQIYTQLDKVPKEIVEEMRSKMRPMHIPFGVIEYDSVASAMKASLELTDQSDWRRGMRVELVVKVKKNPNTEVVEKENKNNDIKLKKKTKKKKTKRPSDLNDLESSSPSQSPKSTHTICIPSSNPRQVSPLSKSYGGSSPGAKNRFNPILSFADNEERGRSNSFGPLSSSPGRWVQKKIDLKKAATKKVSNLVLREPKGPDGEKGFTLRRTLPVSMIPLPADDMPLSSQPCRVGQQENALFT